MSPRGRVLSDLGLFLIPASSAQLTDTVLDSDTSPAVLRFDTRRHVGQNSSGTACTPFLRTMKSGAEYQTTVTREAWLVQIHCSNNPYPDEYREGAVRPTYCSAIDPGPSISTLCTEAWETGAQFSYLSTMSMLAPEGDDNQRKVARMALGKQVAWSRLSIQLHRLWEKLPADFERDESNDPALKTLPRAAVCSGHFKETITKTKEREIRETPIPKMLAPCLLRRVAVAVPLVVVVALLLTEPVRSDQEAGTAIPAESRPCVDCHAFEFMQRALQDLKKTAYNLDTRTETLLLQVEKRNLCDCVAANLLN
ncbi:hypothetical protein AV530_017184 [Patagioenas fasciata monilis]|uniref:NELL2-interacting cell ontogeny regulator 1 n=1 Tax=Patagioenas fasciata monilis TaxID=372326 RepID=A0A1V4JF03_PATFA|nr:hypothetical protein AV530_017184 [Patagioenas fasciata monilis]